MKYLFDILKHKWFIIVAGFKIGGVSFLRLLIHDFSKFTPKEFFSYRKRYELGNCPKEEWDMAWLNHIHHNPHHWQYWILNGRPLSIPNKYLYEMVVDWFAAGRSYNGSWDIQDWVNREFSKMILHEDSISKLEGILNKYGIKLPKKF